MPPKGGSRRQAIATYDADGLLEALEAWVKKQGPKALSFGVYDSLPRSKAVNGRGLLANKEFIDMLIEKAPSGEIHAAWLANTFQSLVRKFAFLNEDMDIKMFGGFKAERVGTLLNHYRRCKTDGKRAKEAASKLDEGDQSVFLRWFSCEMEEKKQRTMSKHDSNVSVDSDGFPLMLKEASNADSGWDQDLEDKALSELLFETMSDTEVYAEDEPVCDAAASAHEEQMETDEQGDHEQGEEEQPEQDPCQEHQPDQPHPCEVVSEASTTSKQAGQGSQGSTLKVTRKPMPEETKLYVTYATNQSYIQMKGPAGKKQLRLT